MKIMPAFLQTCDRMRFPQAPSSQPLDGFTLTSVAHRLVPPATTAGYYIWHQSPQRAFCPSVSAWLTCHLHSISCVVFREIKPMFWQLPFPHPEEKWGEEGWKKRTKPTVIGSCWQNLTLNIYRSTGMWSIWPSHSHFINLHPPRDQNEGLTPASSIPPPDVLPFSALNRCYSMYIPVFTCSSETL